MEPVTRLADVLSNRWDADAMFLFVESLMGAASALGGPSSLSALTSAMSTGRNQFRLMELPSILQWVDSVAKAPLIERVKAYSIFVYYFCDVGCFLGSAVPGQVISESTAAACGKYGLITWGTFVLLAVFTNYKAYKRAKPGTGEHTKAKWEFIRQSLWLLCIINWVRVVFVFGCGVRGCGGVSCACFSGKVQFFFVNE